MSGMPRAEKGEGRLSRRYIQAPAEARKKRRTRNREGKPAESELFLRLTTGDADDLMPQDGDPLPPKQIELVKRWIVEGAKFDGTTETAALAGLLQPVEHPPAPESYPSPVPITALEFGPEGERLLPVVIVV